MKDHARLLGGLYMGWAASQAVSVALYLSASRMRLEGGNLWALSAMTLLIVVLYAFAGWRLWSHDLRARPLAIGLAVVALLSLPVGTALGVYALWALFKRIAPRPAQT